MLPLLVPYVVDQRRRYHDRRGREMPDCVIFLLQPGIVALVIGFFVGSMVGSFFKQYLIGLAIFVLFIVAMDFTHGGF